MDVLQSKCAQCNKSLSNISNLRKHVKKFHPEKSDYLASLQLRKNKHYSFSCTQCDKNYSNISDLRKHVKKFHPEKSDYVASLQLRKNKHYPFSCDKCIKRFSNLKHLRFHAKTHEDQGQSVGSSSTTKFCAGTDTDKKNQWTCTLCDNFSADRKTVTEHYRQFHSICINLKEMMFETEEEFATWKETFEDNTNSKYVVESRKSFKTHVSTHFICHRSGRYVPKGKSLRHLKTQGSNKINALCPAKIRLKRHDNGACEVTIIDKHIGHQNDLGHLNLSKSERESIAAKIAAKIPFEDILDEIRDSITNSELKRQHLLTKKDLYNIEACFNLCSSSVRHSNDVISVGTWVNEMRSKGDSVLFYKPQGCKDEEWLELRANDFILIIMTAAQCEMLELYGSDCICIDRTHGMNSYEFELITLLVVDDIRGGFPCSFLISNRSDKDVLNIFFHYVKSRIGASVNPTVFMSDMADFFYNAWLETMSIPKLRLYCTWHVDQAWRKNLSKVNTKDKQAFVYQNLRAVLEERDVTTFNIMINNLYAMLLEDTDTVEFAKYFGTYYSNCVERWAYCYRLGAGINTNMHLERMHRTLEYTYSKGQKVKRLDKAINAIMRLVRDKCIDRLIVMSKGKLSSKLQQIRSRHERSANLKEDSITECENGWNLPSETTTELYLIQKIQENCNCQLLCVECKACIHQFCCSCIDSSVKFNMCKHIHLLIKYIENKRAAGVAKTPEVQESGLCSEDNLVVEQESHALEAQAHLRELSNTKTMTSFEARKQRVLNLLDETVCNVHSMMSEAELDVVERAINPIKPTLSALRYNNDIQPQTTSKESANKLIKKEVCYD